MLKQARPKLEDQVTQDFIGLLIAANVQPPKGLPQSSQDEHLEAQIVECITVPGLIAEHCWYNCKLHTEHAGGAIVFGWGLWKAGDAMVAQHHAVWKSPNGTLYDLTPCGHPEVLFLPDRRAPFDFDELRVAFNMYWSPGKSERWYSHGIDSVPHFAIGRMDGAAVDLMRKRMAAARQNYIKAIQPEAS